MYVFRLNSKILCFACWGGSMSLYVFYYCISYSSCYCPSFNLSLCCLSPSVCLMSLFKSQYVACWNFTLTWPRQCQVLCSQWLALLNYIIYLWYLKLAANLVSWLLSVVVVVLLKESVPHLDLFDGILYNLLKEKWKYACRYRFDTKDNVNVYIRQCKGERELEIIQH